MKEEVRDESHHEHGGELDEEGYSHRQKLECYGVGELQKRNTDNSHCHQHKKLPARHPEGGTIGKKQNNGSDDRGTAHAEQRQLSGLKTRLKKNFADASIRTKK